MSENAQTEFTRLRINQSNKKKKPKIIKIAKLFFKYDRRHHKHWPECTNNKKKLEMCQHFRIKTTKTYKHRNNSVPLTKKKQFSIKYTLP